MTLPLAPPAIRSAPIGGDDANEADPADRGQNERPHRQGQQELQDNHQQTEEEEMTPAQGVRVVPH